MKVDSELGTVTDFDDGLDYGLLSKVVSKVRASIAWSSIRTRLTSVIKEVDVVFMMSGTRFFMVDGRLDLELSYPPMGSLTSQELTSGVRPEDMTNNPQPSSWRCTGPSDSG